jgi:hypothetical protein
MKRLFRPLRRESATSRRVSRTNVKKRVFGAGVAFLAASGAWAEPTKARVPTVELSPEGSGVVSQYTPDGRLLRRFVGLVPLSDLSISGPGRLFGSEPARERALEWEVSGKVLRTWTLSGRQIYQVTLLPNGNVLLASGKAGLAEVNASGKDVWKLPAPELKAEVVSAVLLGDGSVVFAASNARPPLYRVVPGEATARPWGPPDLEAFVDMWVRPRIQVIDRARSLLALFYQPWDHWLLLRAGKGGSFSVDTVPFKTRIHAIGGGKNGVWISTQGFDLVRLSLTGKEQTWFATPYVANAVTEAEDGTLFAAFVRQPDYVRLAHPPRPGGRAPFPWSRLVAFFVAALAVLTALQVWVWRAPAPPPEAVTSASALDDPPRPVSAGLRWLSVVCIAIGFLLCARGGARLRWSTALSVPYYLAGVAAVVLPGQLLARRSGERRSRWWEEVLAARVAAWTLAPSAVVLGLVILGAAVLWRWCSSAMHYESSVCLWVALNVLCIGLALLTKRPPRLAALRIPVETTVHIGVLLALSGLVLFHDLKNVPRDYDQDVGWMVDGAVKLVRGQVENIFSSGFANISWAGHITPVIGVLLAGPTPVGGRLGGSIMATLAVLGTYVLGRHLRSPRIGFLAGTFLLALTSFVHWSRMTDFGEVVPFAVWLLVALLAAVKNPRPGLWLVFGLLGGWSLLLFFAARIVLLAVVMAAVVLSLRSWRVTRRRVLLPVFFAAGFAVTVLPMVPYWKAHPDAFLHRLEESFVLFKPSKGLNPEALKRAFGPAMRDSIGIFFNGNERGSGSTIGPTTGPAEWSLILIGAAAFLTDGWGANVAVAVWTYVVLLFCGALTEPTPATYRLLCLFPVAALCAGRAADLLLGVLPLKRPALRHLATASVAALFLGAFVQKNVGAYQNYERTRPPSEFTAFGEAALRLGPRYQFYCLTFQRPDFSAQHGSFVPYLETLDVKDLRDLSEALPFPPGRPVAVMIPYRRLMSRYVEPQALESQIVASYPEATVQTVTAPAAKNQAYGVIVVIDSLGGQKS